MIIKDEASVRDLIADALDYFGLGAVCCTSLVDLPAEIELHRPPLIFLDIGLGESNALDVIMLLSSIIFAGHVQIVSGYDPTVLSEVCRIGKTKGLQMLPPLRKPFKLEAIETALGKIGVLPAAENRKLPALLAPVTPAFIARPWLTSATGKIGHIDLKCGRLGQVQTLSTEAVLRNYIRNAAQLDRQLSHLPGTYSFNLDIRLNDFRDSGFARIFDLQSISALAAAVTCCISEAELFSDLDFAREMVLRMRISGMRVRMEDCGAHFLALTSRQPLPVDDVVISRFLLGRQDAAGRARLLRVRDIIGRSGAEMLADDVDCEPTTKWFAESGFSFCRDRETVWKPIERLEAQRKPLFRSAIRPNWQAIPVTDLHRFQVVA
jgi:CheY-like chemotaxis protein